VYNRDAVLQSTVDPTPGLEHSLAWRPSGNFLATTQRFFGPEFGCGGGVGREGRHDFVFFERNGLRRLEVDGQWAESPKAPPKDTEGRVTWGYKVMEMSWSSDSNILAIFLRDSNSDIGK
jgi:elongator complex protein 1